MINLLFTIARVLYIPPSAYTLSLGGALTADNASSSIYFNPAVSANITTPEIAASQMIFINAGYSSLLLGFNFTWGNIYVFPASYYSTGIELRDSQGNIINNGNVINTSILLNYSKAFSHVSFGINTGLLSSKLLNDNAGGIFCDIGLRYSLLNNLSIGLSLLHLGTPIKHINISFPQPLTLSLGLKYSLFNNTPSLFISYDRNLTNHESVFKGGIEISYLNIIFLRSGMKATFVKNETNTYKTLVPSLGLGINTGKFYTDISYAQSLLTGFIMLTAGYRFNLKGFEKTQTIVKETNEKEQATAQIFYNKGITAMNNGDLKTAENMFDIASIWDPENNEIAEKLGEIKARIKTAQFNEYLNRAKQYYNNNDYFNALYELERAKAIYPENKEVNKYIELSRTAIALSMKETEEIKLKIEKAYKYFTSKQYDKALKICNNILKESPNNKEAEKLKDNISKRRKEIVSSLIKSAVTLAQKGNYSAALNKLYKAKKYGIMLEEINTKINQYKKSNKTNIDVTLNKGITAYNQKNYKSASIYFNTVLKIEPNNSKAKEYLNKISKKNVKKYSKKEIENMYFKGLMAYTNENYTLAISYWEKVLEMDPKHVKARNNLKRATAKLNAIAKY